MAVIRPFAAFRPRPEAAAEVAALPYDVMTLEEARQMVQGKPCSFLHVDRAEMDLPEGTDPYCAEVYEKARQNLQRLFDTGVYLQEEKPCFYIYRQTLQGRAQTGLVACASIEDYVQNHIRKHELTRAEKEEDRVRHVESCRAHTGPIFLAYRHQEDIRRRLNIWMERPPVYQFTSEDAVGHEIWVIDDEAVQAFLTMRFSEIPDLYIADGHHRAASAVRVGLQCREQNPEHTGEEEYNYFLAVLFPDDELFIMPYNRVVQDLNGYTPEAFLQQVEKSFTVQPAGEAPQPKRHQFGMYFREQWYLLTVREGLINEADPIGRLDVSILQEWLLRPVLGIQDPRKNPRIDFVGGIHGLVELESRVREGMQLAFCLHPVSMEELLQIADAGEIMPPKSTWFEPKLRSGLFIHRF